jgi:uncharacterized repeat protein (TIGR01451 family)
MGGLLAAFLLVFGLTQTLWAQDGAGADEAPDATPEAYVITSQEDLEALPPEVRQRFEKENGFGQAGSFQFGDSTKVANTDEVLPGGAVTFTITAVNSGNVDSPPMTVVDALPAGLTYLSHEFKVPNGGLQTGGSAINNVITWEGVLGAGGSVEIVITASVPVDAPAGKQYTNTAVISAESETAEPSVKVTVGEASNSPFLRLPIIIYGERPLTPDVNNFAATRPNSLNQWSVTWDQTGAVGYELQEAHRADFSDATTHVLGPVNRFDAAYAPSPFNTFYYRIRSSAGAVNGAWSPTLKVVGGYRDDFDNRDTGWSLRRTSHLDEVKNWYEIEPGKSWNILQVKDRWDLGLASPLMEAPSIPYAIQLEVKSVEPGWQKGLGFVLEGDKVTDQCPSDTNSTDGWYKHKDCFNEFYEFMLVEGANKKNLQVQRVHEVVWLGSGSGGIPVHRKVAKNWYIEKISGVSWDDYNVMRVEVYADHINFYAGKRGEALKLQLVIDENYYPENAYFGTIATTQEYSNSVGRYEYVEALPLDN